MPYSCTVVGVTFKNLDAEDIGPKTNSRNDSSIGAKVQMELEYVSSEDIAGSRLVFNPTLFAPAFPIVDPASWLKGYALEIDQGASIGNIFQMNFWTGTAYSNANLNGMAELEILDTDRAVIRFVFMMTMDLDSPINGVVLPNEKRLGVPHRSLTPNFNPQIQFAQPNVYQRNDRGVRCHILFQNGLGEIFYFRHWEPFQSRWIVRGLGNNTPQPPIGELVALPYDYEVLLIRGNDFVDDISPYEQTEVHVYLVDQSPTWTIGQTFRAYLIKTNPGDNLQTFQSQYGCEVFGSQIQFGTTLDGDDLGGNLIGVTACYTSMMWNGVPSIRLRFNVGTNVDPSAQYGIVVVVCGIPNTGNDTITNTFYLWPFNANGLPSAPVLTSDEFEGNILDYNTDPGTDNVISTVVDHLLLKVRVNRQAYDDLAQSQLLGSTWNGNMWGVKVRIIDETTNEILWQTDFFKPSLPSTTWSGGGTNVLQEVPQGDWNEYSLWLHTCYPNDGGYPDFSNRTIKVLWIFSVGFDSVPQWRVDYRYPQRIFVREYGDLNRQILNLEVLDYPTGLPLQNLCQGDVALVKVTLDQAQDNDVDWNLRVKWSLEPHGFPYNNDVRPSTTPEEESYAGQFPQLDQPEFSLVPSIFADNDGALEASFLFDYTNIPVGQKPCIYVIAEPVNGACPQPIINLVQVVDDCGASQFTIEVDVQNNELFQVEGIAYSVNDGPTTYEPFGPATYILGPFVCTDSVSVHVVRTGSGCDYDLGEFTSGCGPCCTYPDMPTMFDVDFVTTADQQTTLEGAGLPVGTKFLIIDLINATPPGTTLFEQNTGNVVVWTGTGWNIVSMPPGMVVNDLSNGANPEWQRWWVVRGAANGTALYPSGKMALEWLYPVRSVDNDPPGGHRALSQSAYTLIHADDNNLSNCRKATIEVYNALGGVWIPIFTQTELEMLTLGDTDFDNINTRMAWYGGPAGTYFQGYSRERFFV